ncbi:hypothetical protein LSTR_LSTR011990 [Laodelphax striatellus]|uniref:Uncharacterized protein n=1 Tax=Laodelphax striatellus TaxID=195883 RepID=A0A482X3M4_LAOST|nr:hypothetical protein LSTR_LSTR011990 [Laodelphax striatellus]
MSLDTDVKPNICPDITDSSVVLTPTSSVNSLELQNTSSSLCPAIKDDTDGGDISNPESMGDDVTETAHEKLKRPHTPTDAGSETQEVSLAPLDPKNLRQLSSTRLEPRGRPDRSASAYAVTYHCQSYYTTLAR